MLRAGPLSLAIVLAFGLISLAEAAAPQVVVFELDSTLVQRVRSRQKDTFDAKNLITAPDFDEEDNRVVDKRFAVIPGARELIGRLTAPDSGYRLRIATRYPENTAKALLERFLLANGKKLSEVVDDVATAEDFTKDGKLDLARAGVRATDVLYVNGRASVTLAAGQNGSLLPLGTPYYHFPSFALSEADRTAFKDKSLGLTYAPSESAWSLDQQKIARLYVALKENADKGTPAALIAGVRATLAEDPVRLGQVGSLMLAGKFRPQSYAWTYVEGAKPARVRGCQVIATRTGAVQGAANLEKCLEELPTRATWRRNKDLKRVEGCWLTDESGAEIRAAEVGECSGKAASVFAWQGEKADVCAEFTPGDFYFIATTARAQCGEYHVVARAGGESQLVHRYFLGVPLQAAIPEVMAVRDGDVIPAVVYQKYEAESIAFSLVQRLRRLIDGDKGGTPAYNFIENSEIGLTFHSRIFDKIQANCFLNQHQVGSSSANFSPENQIAAENRIMRARLTDYVPAANQAKLKTVLPKYAYLNMQAPFPNSSPPGYSSGYGDIAALMKDEVKARTTYTAGDSWGSMPGDTLFSLALPPRAGGYYEAQVWGPLCFKHVEAFLVGCSILRNFDRAEVDRFKASGVPVHRCKLNAQGFWAKGEAL